jgi:alanine racemase
MRAEARVDLLSITKNVEHLKEISGVEVMAVVKADAYGHGLIPVAQAAVKAGATWLGVALLEEAIALRDAGIKVPILAWLVQPGSDFATAAAKQIDIAVASLKTLEEISAVPGAPRIHIEVDTGMTRGGFLGEWNQLLAADFSKVEVVGVFSHFARADEPGQAQNKVQFDNFNKAVADLEKVGVRPALKHLSNSAATIKDAQSSFNMVRVGIAMYGLSPDFTTLGSSKELGLKPAMQLRAALHLVKEVPAGASIGYGATYVTKSDTKLGVVAMGYADGIPRVSQGVGVFVGGKRAPIVGRVSMDQFVVDLGPDSKAKSGDWVTVFGDGSHGEYTADDWGVASNSICYEIVTRIGPRVPRTYQPHVY